MKDDGLWKVFSLFIRLRDSKEGYGFCCTCNKRVHYKEAHAGHFISRRHQATKYDERNVALQCVGCNTYNQGQQFLFSKYIDNKYGQGTSDELLTLSRSTLKRTSGEIKYLTAMYKDKIKELNLSGQVEQLKVPQVKSVKNHKV